MQFLKFFIVLALCIQAQGQNTVKVDEILQFHCSKMGALDDPGLNNTYDWNFSDPLYPNGVLRIKIMHDAAWSLCKEQIQTSASGKDVKIQIDMAKEAVNLIDSATEGCVLTILEFVDIPKDFELQFMVDGQEIPLLNHKELMGDGAYLAGSFSKKEGFMFTSVVFKKHWNGNVTRSYNYLPEIESKRDYEFYANGQPKVVKYGLFGEVYRVKKFKRSGRLIEDVYLSKAFSPCNL